MDIAYEEINNYSDISFDYEEIKTGRKVTSIRFNIKKSTNGQNKISSVKEDSKQYVNNDNIKLVKDIIENISDNDAEKILDIAGRDIKKIKEKYSIICKFKNINNLTGAMIQSIKEDWKINNTSNRTFNNFEAREYDYDELEKKLLGWE